MPETSALLTAVAITHEEPMRVAVRCIKSQIHPSPVQTAHTRYRSTFCKSLNSLEMCHAVLDESPKLVVLLVAHRAQQVFIVTKSFSCQSWRALAPRIQRRTTKRHQPASTSVPSPEKQTYGAANVSSQPLIVKRLL